MIADRDNNIVYVSDLLEGRFPALVDGLRRILAEHGIPLRVVRGTKDIWCRDYMSVSNAPGEFVRFRYAPDYLLGHERLITRPDDIGPITEVERCADSGIVLDGGNVVGWGSLCIVTDKVFTENPAHGRDELIGRLEGLLGVDDLIVIPKEPYDVVGHADGVVRFLDGGLVVVNDYSGVAPSYGKRLTSILRRTGLEWVVLPYQPRDDGGEIPSAVGCYANFLRVRGLIVVPSFGRPEDDLACRVIEDNTSGLAVVPLECSGLAREGGVLNCVTWTVSTGHVSLQSKTHTENE